MKKAKITALMPMKHNSERLPNKNIKEFHGKPLYNYVLQSLIKSRYIEEIIINTDIDEVLDMKNVNNKVRIIKRPKKLCGDFAPFFDIIEHDMNQTKAEIFLHTHSTNPLVKTQTINDAILTFMKNVEYDSLLSVTKHRKRMYYANKKPINHDPQDKLLRTQDLKPIYMDNSCLYIFTRESFFKAEKHRIGEKPFFFEMDEIESIDIDYENDFIIAEKIYEVLKGNR
jgi:CMP-N-acetylneuraminic acid synthetase